MVLLSRYNSVANDRLRAAEGGLRGSPPQISLLDLEHQIKCIAKFYILNHICHQLLLRRVSPTSQFFRYILHTEMFTNQVLEGVPGFGSTSLHEVIY